VYCRIGFGSVVVHSCYFTFENNCYLHSFLYFASLVQGVSINPLMESILKIHVQQYIFCHDPDCRKVLNPCACTDMQIF